MAKNLLSFVIFRTLNLNFTHGKGNVVQSRGQFGKGCSGQSSNRGPEIEPWSGCKGRSPRCGSLGGGAEQSPQIEKK